MRPNLIFSRFCKLFSGPFKENILGIGLLFWRPQNNWHFWHHFLVSIILKVTCPHPEDGWRHQWHHKQDIRCYLSITWIVWSPDFSPRMSALSQSLCLTVDTVISSHRVQITKCWQGSWISHIGTIGPANWLQLPLSVDGCLLSSVWSSKAMVISNPLCLQWTFQFCQLYIIRLPGGDEMMLLGHRALSLLSAQLPWRKSQCWCLETCCGASVGML